MKNQLKTNDKNKIPVIQSKEHFHDGQKFDNVSYSSLSQDFKPNINYDRKFSIESVHAIQKLKSTTYCETLMHLIKGNIGCGILAIGMAFKNGGLVLSVIMIIIFGIISCYNQHILITMADEFKRMYNLEMITFAETIGFAFETGPQIFQKFSSFIKRIITFFIIVTQLGSCSVYVVFMSQSLDQILSCYDIVVNKRILMAVVFPIIWITSLIKHFKYIVPLSLLANISTAGGLSLILRSSATDLPPFMERELIGNWNQLPLCIGTMVFSLEGISVSLPLQQNMKKKETFVGRFGALNVALFFSTALSTILGFFGYWKFGDDVKESLTLNLELRNNILSQLIIICMTIGILCTYALQFFIPVLLILPKVKNWPTFIKNEYVLRTTLVLFTFFVAEVIPHFDLFSSLIGAIGGTFLAFIFCPLADIAFRKKEDRGKFNWKLIFTILSLIIGIVAFMFGTVVTLKEIIISIKNDLKM